MKKNTLQFYYLKLLSCDLFTFIFLDPDEKKNNNKYKNPRGILMFSKQ